MIEKYLRDEVIELKVKAGDWKEAVRKAGGILEKNRLTEKSYTESMITAVEEMGPYMVIMPGIAFAHARPGEEVLDDCLSLITLDKPVEFGHKTNDPVDIVFAIGAKSSDNHIGFIQDLADILDSEENISFIKECEDKKELLNKIINQEG